MKQRLTFIIALYFFIFAATAQSNTKDVVVRVWAEVSSSPPSITLRWNMFASTQNITIYKKALTDADWTTVAILPNPTDTFYKVPSPVTGVATEWRVQKDIFTSGKFVTYGNGYVYTGVNIPEDHGRGDLLLLITRSLNDSLQTEIGLAMADMIGDGWTVDTALVDATASPVVVKDLVNSWYINANYPVSVLLLGHVAVPYSGNMQNGGISTYPADGHTPDHDGAWVADAWYGDVNGKFTDSIALNILAKRSANQNRPKDGKYDQVCLPTLSELEIGRVDLSDLPSFRQSETQLTRQYLNKLHTYKTAALKVPRRGLIDDRLGYMGGEAPARGAWHSMVPAFGEMNITESHYYKTLRKDPYLMAHVAGWGNYTQYVYVMNSVNYQDTIKAVFNSSFGSEFADWDNSDNIMRACLASPDYTLTNCWSGRPEFLFHHMALGKTVGFSTRATQNNFALSGVKKITYPVPFMSGRMHISLMGDPTLRLHTVIPPSDVTATVNLAAIYVSWGPSADNNIVGYNVYRSDDDIGPYTKLNSIRLLSNVTTFTDLLPLKGQNYYMVRAVKYDSSASGTYYNPSIGAIDDVTYVGPPKTIVRDHKRWRHGKKLEKRGRRYDDYNFQNRVDVKNTDDKKVVIYPNPTTAIVSVVPSGSFMNSSYIVNDVHGKLILSGTMSDQQMLELNLTAYASGLYYISFTNAKGQTATGKIILTK